MRKPTKPQNPALNTLSITELLLVTYYRQLTLCEQEAFIRGVAVLSGVISKNNAAEEKPAPVLHLIQGGRNESH